MPINHRNQRSFTKKLFAGIHKTVTLLHREDDQREGVVTSYLIFGARRSQWNKTGEPIQGDMASETRTLWHLPRRELDRLGIKWINAADRIVESSDNFPNDQSRVWMPEARTLIENKLFELEVDLACTRLDPPRPPS